MVDTLGHIDIQAWITVLQHDFLAESSIPLVLQLRKRISMQSNAMREKANTGASDAEDSYQPLPLSALPQ